MRAKARTVRAFVGLPMPAAYQDQLERARHAIGRGLRSKLNWVKKGNWHLTLKFLGQSTEEQLAAFRAECEKIVYAPFVFQAGGAGVFPRMKPSGEIRPRVLWTGIRRGEPELRSLADGVAAAALAAGYAPEERVFSPHLTVARIKHPEADAWDKVLAALGALAWPEIVMNRFVLWKSVPGPGGPEYTALHEFAACA